nr:zinc finger, CCHC-type [Tanacetum cinerariifolium]
MQMQESKIDIGKALDASLVVMECSGTESEKHDTSSRSRNDVDDNNAYIKPVYDKEPMDEITLRIIVLFQITNTLFVLHVINENPIHTLGDYSKPSHEGYRNTIELPVGNNVDLTTWLECLLAGSIATWKDLTTCFLAQFFPLGRIAKLRMQIFYDRVDHTLKRTVDYAAGGRLMKMNAENSWATIEELARYEDEGWNELVASGKGSLDYENPNIEQLLGVMECKVDTFTKEAISLIGRSESLYGITSNTVYQIPSEPSRQEEFEDLVMNFILDQEEENMKLKEYTCVIGSDFMQLSLEKMITPTQLGFLCKATTAADRRVSAANVDILMLLGFEQVIFRIMLHGGYFKYWKAGLVVVHGIVPKKSRIKGKLGNLFYSW